MSCRLKSAAFNPLLRHQASMGCLLHLPFNLSMAVTNVKERQHNLKGVGDKHITVLTEASLPQPTVANVGEAQTLAKTHVAGANPFENRSVKGG